ncbi:MAG: MFS transporter [Clostridia bacterium]|nr:MFS transporter [Clostridia bacterium]
MRFTPIKFIKNRLAMLWPPIYDSLGENADGCARGRRGMLFGNFFAGASVNLISGLYFTGLLLAMNASDAYIGYISVGVTACGFIQIVSPMVLERMQRRKVLLMTLRGIFYFINIFVLGTIPLLPIDNGLRLGIFMVAVMLMNLVSSFGSPGMSIWHMQNVPDSKRATFFSLSSMGGTIIGSAITFSAGLLMDGFESSSTSLWGINPTLSAIVVLRAIALVFAIGEFVCFAKIKEHPYVSKRDTPKVGPKMYLLPLKNRPFMAMLCIQLAWSFTTAIIGQYYTVYLISDVGVSYAFLSSMSVISIPLSLIFTPVWASVINRRGWLPTLSFAMLVYSLAYFGNVFVTASTVPLYIGIVILCNVFSPGISLSFSNLPYMRMPNENRTVYLSVYTTCTSLAGMLGGFIGTQIITSTAGLSLNIFGLEAVNKQYINLLQFALVVTLAVLIGIYGRKERAEKKLSRTISEASQEVSQ